MQNIELLKQLGEVEPVGDGVLASVAETLLASIASDGRQPLPRSQGSAAALGSKLDFGGTQACLHGAGEAHEKRCSPRRSGVSRRKALRRISYVLGAGVVALVVALLLGSVELGSPNTSEPNVARLDWRLVSSTDPPLSFQSTQSTSGAVESTTCPTSFTCYEVVAGGFQGAGNGTPLAATAYASNDGGIGWRQLSLPPGVFLTTPFTCLTSKLCMVAATVGAEYDFDSPPQAVQSLLLVTNDGGASWVTHAIPVPAAVTGADTALDPVVGGTTGVLDHLTCFTEQRCVGFGFVPSDQEEQVSGSEKDKIEQFPAWRTVFVRTDDGGATWNSYDFPWMANPDGSPGSGNVQFAQFSCSTDRSCVGLAQVMKQGGVDSLIVWSTVDGGAIWTHHWITNVHGVMNSSFGLSCPDATSCFATIGLVNDQSHLVTRSVVLVSNDAGTTWSKRSVGPSGAQLNSVSCLTSTDCWVGGSTRDESSAIIYATVDGGRNWSAADLPSHLRGVASIDCRASGCLAVASANPGFLVAHGDVWSTPSVLLSNGP
jgi:hypothetical protein